MIIGFRKSAVVGLMALAIGTSAVCAQADSSDSVASSQGVKFDMDPTKTGLDYLNYIDDYSVKRGTSTAGAISGVGASEATSVGQGRSDKDHPKPLLPAVTAVRALDYGAAHAVAVVLLPLSMSGDALEFDRSDKFMTNRPVGRRSGSGTAATREMGTVVFESAALAAPEGGESVDRTTRSRSSGSVASSRNTLFQFPMPDETTLEVSGYETALPEKQNANRATSRSSRGGGRGNGRNLYPAHPERP
ncbi:MAG: hypothetical protein AAFX93_02535 [Verrucomicrobiota bacterium]